MKGIKSSQLYFYVIIPNKNTYYVFKKWSLAKKRRLITKFATIYLFKRKIIRIFVAKLQ